MTTVTSASTGRSSKQCIIGAGTTKQVSTEVNITCRQDKKNSVLRFVYIVSQKLTSERCAPISSGYEPRRLFNVVEFLMNDKDDSGSVSVEEAMQILYLRFGKGLLDSVGPCNTITLSFFARNTPE